jgi:hypothetical protein
MNMDNEPTLFDNILYNNLRPWLSSNNPDEKFAPLLSEIKTIYPESQFLYEIDFHRPFNHKTKYYNKLIINEANSYCNKIINLVNEDKNIKIQKYWINDTLNKKMQTRLKDIGKIIKDKDYQLIYINPRKTSFNIDSEHKTNTYIIQLLKQALVKVYLEIQEAFKSLLANDPEIEDDLYTQFLFESIPEHSFLKEAPKVITIESNEATPRGTKPPEFKPIVDDIRDIEKGVASYHFIIRNPQRFASFEEKLFTNGYLNMDYTFTHKHGYKNELAIIFHLLIEKGYFNKFNDADRKLVTPREIVKFLSYRYKTDVDKQFRAYNNKIQEIVTFTEKHSWLYNLPSC